MDAIIPNETLVLLLVNDSVMDNEKRYQINHTEPIITRLLRCFSSAELMGVPIDQISIARNDTSRQIYGKLRSLANNDQQTTIIYYIGHALFDNSGEIYLGTSDTNLGNGSTNGLAYSQIKDLLSQFRSVNNYLIMDCSLGDSRYGKEIGKIEYLPPSSKKAEDPRIFMTILASSPSNQQLYDNFKNGQPFFTSRFTEIIQSGAKDIKDDYLTMLDIYFDITDRCQAAGYPRPYVERNELSAPVGFVPNIAFEGRISAEQKEKRRARLAQAQQRGYKELKSKLHSDEFFTDEDILGYDLHASNLFNILTNSQTKPPMNIGILAPWGRGKTSLMRRIELLFKDAREGEIVSRNWKEAYTLKDVRKWLKGEEDVFKEFPIPFATVWFNPWNYQSSEMIWAGLANAIIEQIVEQMPNKHIREAFWMKLRLDRVDRTELRRDLQVRAVIYFMQMVTWGCAAIMTVLSIIYWRGIIWPTVGWGLVCGTFSSIANYLKPNKKTINEVFDKYTKPPQYLNKLGTFHDVQDDLKKVFKLLIPKDKPLVIFVDDLDRCSPSKVVEVVEAINIFISGDYRQQCYFILGMDAEIVAASLDVAYERMKGKMFSREMEQGSLGWYFLDKFIQLPFFIPVMSESKKLDFLALLLNADDQVIDVAHKNQESAVETLSDTQVKTLADQILASGESEHTAELMKRLNREDSLKIEKEILRQQVENTEDDEAIHNEISRYSAYLNADPRTLKRFANLLRFYNSYQVLRMKKDQFHLPLDQLGKYLVLMLRFPQLIRWIQWDTENKNGFSTSAIAKIELLDNAIDEIPANLDTPAKRFDYWTERGQKGISANDRKNIIILIEMHKDMPWLKSEALFQILWGQNQTITPLMHALDANIW